MKNVRPYRIMRMAICSDSIRGSQYINHMLVVGPQGGLLVFSKEACERVVKRVYKLNGVATQQMILNSAKHLADMTMCTTALVPYVKPAKNNYTMIAKSYGARLADDTSIKALADYLTAVIESRKVVG